MNLLLLKSLMTKSLVSTQIKHHPPLSLSAPASRRIPDRPSYPQANGKVMHNLADWFQIEFHSPIACNAFRYY